MKDIKLIIAENISSLRRDGGMTQAMLAEKLNYSDKAVSKWERGESVPDVAVLKEIADLFGVTVDYLLTGEHEVSDIAAEDDSEAQSDINPADTETEHSHRKKVNHISITSMSIVLVWLLASFSFIMNDIISPVSGSHWLAFVYAVPVSCIVWLVFNSLWFNRRRNFLIISLLMWTMLAALFLTFLPFGINVSKIFGLGVPGQVIIFLWSRLKRTGR